MSTTLNSLLTPTQTDKPRRMSKSNQPIQVIHKGKSKEFFVFIESQEIAEKYQKDSTVPLSDVVGVFKVYTSEQGRGSEGVFEEASKLELENEFGSKHVEDVIQKILKTGTFQHAPNLNKNRYNSTNDSMGHSIGH